MAGNSVESLLQWMRGGSRSLGWDAIIWLDRKKLNRFLLQEYISRFSTGHYLEPITDSKGTVPSETEYLYDYTLDYPRLSFLSTQEENDEALQSIMALTMRVVGGSQVTLKQSQGVKRAIRVDSIDPLDGPSVRMNLDLPAVTGAVGDDGRVDLDLSKGYNFKLSYGQTEFMDNELGKLFKKKFEEIPIEERVYPLSVLAPGTNRFMRPDKFLLRTQQVNEQARNPNAVEYEDGALVVFVAMTGSKVGTTPTVGSDFRYLIPDDEDKNYSAAILYSREIVTYAPIANQFFGRLTGIGFRVERDASGRVTQIIATSGSYTTPRRTLSQKGDPFDPHTFPEYELTVDPFTYSYAETSNPLRIQFGTEGNFEIHFSIIGDSTVRFVRPGTEVCTVKCDLEFAAWMEIQITNTSDGPVFSYSGDGNQWFPTNRVQQIGFPQPYASDQVAWWQLRSRLCGPTSTGSVDSYSEKFWTVTWGDWRSNRLNRQFFLTLNLPFGHALDVSPYDMRLPLDMVVFAKIDPSTTAFTISPTELVLGAGDNHTFRTEPTLTGVTWSVHNIMGDTGSKGTISAGKYTAPTAAQIDGYYRRVRVTATKGEHTSSALVSVVIRDITINPLIQICEPEQSLKVWAGTVGSGNLKFRTMDQSFGGTVVPNLVDPEKRHEHIYTAGPKKTDVVFHIEEIQVTNELTNRSQITRVLVEHRAAVLAVSIVGSAGLPADQLKFEAVLDESEGPIAGVKWQILAGSGQIDADTAIYTVDPSGEHRYAVIMASFVFPGLGSFYGYFILPLPLTEFPAVMQALTH